MKNIAKISTVIAFMFATVAGLAKEPTLNVTKGKDKSVVLTLAATSKGAKVKLADAESNIMYSQKISEGNFAKKYNLKNLDNGTYFLTVEENLKEYSYTIKISDDEVKLAKVGEQVKPFFRKTSDMIYMNYLNLGKDDLSIKIYDLDNRVVFTEKISEKIIVEKAFNFKDAHDGVYTVVVDSPNGNFTETLVVN